MSYFLRKAAAILIGSLLVGVGVNLFLVTEKLLDGGIIGIGLLSKYYLDWPVGAVIILVSIPIYVVVFFRDRPLFYNSFLGLILSSISIDALSVLRPYSFLDAPDAAVTGGVFIGAGIGLMLAYETNTGGTDLLAQFLARRTGISVALLIFLIDGVIVVSGLEVIGPYHTVFSLLTITSVAITTHYFSQVEKRRSERLEVIPLSQWLRKQK